MSPNGSTRGRAVLIALLAATLAAAPACVGVRRRAHDEGEAEPGESPRSVPREGTIFTGVIVPMITCYREGNADEVDLEATAQLTEWLCSTRATSPFPVSGMGQWAKLRLAEKEAIIRTVVKAAAGRKPVLAGVGSPTDADETVALARFARGAGADAIVVVTPDWLRAPSGQGIPDQDALFAYYERVARVGLPVMIYDRKAEVLPATMTRLAALPNVAAIKYRTRDAMAIVRMTRAAGDRVAVLAGIEHITLPVLAAGGRGTVGGGGNLFPDLLVDLIGAYRAGDHARARALQDRVIEANDRLGRLGGSKLAIKRLLRDVIGLDGLAVNDRDSDPPREVDAGTLHENRTWLIENAGLRPWRP